ncbi:hypothetical protein [Actinoalloteichus sp. GBA129-24]|uniref:hypothetical protein n=1 Tax=Actinoalloteichus sp. GBA129-24 TaxID=1612551 RepID=UPI0009507D31|nr:hypothetical protein [Actinoalloteichus sp. GBA129-24]APU20594.1 hypothetical protein UA75_12920 [Actinoalloteichus sp. GBA129-24]
MSMPPQPGPYGPPGGWQQQPGPQSGGFPQQPGGYPQPGGPPSGGFPQQQPGPQPGWSGQQQGWGGQQPGYGPQYDPAGSGGPGGPKKSPLPWILGGGGVLVVVLIVVLVLVLGDDSDGGATTDAGGSGAPGDSRSDGGGGDGSGGGVSGSPEQAAQTLAEAVTNEDFQTFVDMTCTQYQDELGVSGVEDFAAGLDPGAIDPSLAAIEVAFTVDAVAQLSPGEAEARMLISYTNVPAEMADYLTEMAMYFTLVPEDGQWKVCDYRVDENSLIIPTY